jgi:hypothetical protein
MPSIKISEVDLTYGGGSATNYEVVYVPGFMGANGKAKAKTPTLCNSVSEFEEYFGTDPAKFKDLSGTETFDKSYIYAKELLKLGLPVLYESVNDTTTTGPFTQDSIYQEFKDGLFNKLTDKGEYQFKYLTSGGYPLYTTTVTPSSSASDTTAVTVLPDNFPKIENTTKYQFLYTSECVWKQFYTDTSGAMQDTGFTFEGDYITMPIGDSDKNVYGIYVNITSAAGVITKNVFLHTTHPYTPTIGDKIEVTDNGENLVAGLTRYTSDTPTNSINCAANVALNRGDCIVLVDHDDEFNVTNESYNTLIAGVADGIAIPDSCAMFTPWVNINSTVTNKTESLPGSFAYLSALAKSIKSNASWLAVAGATRGQIPGLDGINPLSSKGVLSNSLADSLQPRNTTAINAITDIKPFGYRIWGNRTLKANEDGNLTATSFLNIRSMICDVKKVVYEACRRYTFEQNTDVLWLNFKSYIEPTLNRMKTSAGLSGYKVIRCHTDEKAKLVAQIKLYPLYAVEDFTVEVQMLDDEIAVS